MLEPMREPRDGSYTLAVEGSTYEGSVALLRAREDKSQADVIAERTLHAEEGGVPRAGRGERLMPAISECLRDGKIEGSAVARIVCGAGPGSFTSLRVAASIAKGLAAGYGVDLFAVSSLLLTVTGAQPLVPHGEYLSVLDAMRGEFFVSRIVIGPDAVAAETEPPSLISAAQLEELELRERTLKVIGPGQQIDAHPHARGVGPILRSLLEAGPVDLASWEPDYGRRAEAQVRWEAAHGRPLAT